MKKGGRGGQRVVCACVSKWFSKPESVRGRGMIAHTPALFCFPPTDTPAETGHPWPTYSLLLTPAHADLSFFSDRSDRAQPLHPCSRFLVPHRKAEPVRFANHIPSFANANIQFCIFVCLPGFYCCRGDSKTGRWGGGQSGRRPCHDPGVTPPIWISKPSFGFSFYCTGSDSCQSRLVRILFYSRVLP